MKTIQASGKTLDGAVENALKQLELTRDQVEVKVLQEGGFLRNFKVEVTEILTPAQKIQEFLQNIITKMGVDGVVELGQQDDAIVLNIKCENTGNVIGYRGETLDALQYLCSLMLNEKSSGFKRVILDCEGYRQKREKTLKKLAGNIEQKVKRTGVAVSLEPMNPYERRIIHTALQNSKYVTTESEGQGVNRHIVVSPKNQSNILNAVNAPRKTLNFVYRSEKKKRR
ncbi:MAG: protein jag [Clostridia bacterium]|nr:protein jag [Clostridia bacterium]